MNTTANHWWRMIFVKVNPPRVSKRTSEAEERRRVFPERLWQVVSILPRCATNHEVIVTIGNKIINTYKCTSIVFFVLLVAADSPLALLLIENQGEESQAAAAVLVEV
jgi:hypothetical protein